MVSRFLMVLTPLAKTVVTGVRLDESVSLQQAIVTDYDTPDTTTVSKKESRILL